MTTTGWPQLIHDTWAPTKRSLHCYAQMLGKLRLALSPHQPNFAFTALTVTPRGFSTGLIPYGPHALTASVDVFSAQLIIESSSGERHDIGLGDPCTVARVFAEVHTALARFGIHITLSPIPQEVADTTPFDHDERPAAFDVASARNWHTAMVAMNNVFDRWRSHFAGRNGIYLWWGGFDFGLLLFNGNRVPAPTDRGYLIKYDLDAEMLSAGFYPGDDVNPAVFYAYIYPQPPGAPELPISATGAGWSETAKEWILPYQTVQQSADPEAVLQTFLDRMYAACGSLAGWDIEGLRYAAPPLRRGK